MVNLIIKKFALRYNGKTYKAGDIVKMPKDKAIELVKQSPDEFSILDVDASMQSLDPPPINDNIMEKYETLTNNQLIDILKDKELALPQPINKASLLQEIKNYIEQHGDIDDEDDGEDEDKENQLPPPPNLP